MNLVRQRGSVWFHSDSETNMAESGMSAPANCPRLVEKADAQSLRCQQ